MAAPLIWFVGVIYLVVAIDQWRKGDHGMALAWLGYSLANVGLGLRAR